MSEPPKHRLGYEDTLNLVTSLCLTYTLGVAALRFWIRRSIHGLDDVVYGAAILLALGHFAANYIALDHGGGKPYRYIELEHNVSAYNRASVASAVFFVISLYLSKCAVVAFLLRLTKHQSQVWLYRICLATLGLLGFFSVLIVTVGWPLPVSSEYWTFYTNEPACHIQTTRWDIFTAFDIFTEVILLALPVYQTWSLQMPLSKKATVVSAFWLRMPVIGLSVGRLVYTQRLCHRGVNPGLDSSLVLMWFSIEMSYAIVASAFSALRAFTLDFNSTFGFGFTMNAGPESYTMSRMTGNRSHGASAAQESKRGISHSPASAKIFKSSNGSQNRDAARSPPGIHSSQSRSFAEISANHHHAPYTEHKWREEDDNGILRETEYTVERYDNDERPILRNSDGSRV